MSKRALYIDLEDAERLAEYEQQLDLEEGSGGWQEPLPLIRPPELSLPYPHDELGPVLGNAAKAISSIVQCPFAIAASSVLAVASLAAQPHVDVVHPVTDRRIPVSLFLLTIAESGERKSAADAEALAPVRQHEKVGAEQYKLHYGQWRNRHEAWETARNALKRKAKGDWTVLERELSALGEEPKPPPKPYLIVTEPTFEGLAKLMAESQPSMGLFSAEGGGFLGGHAMREDSRLRALTGLSELWDGSPLKRTRAGDGAFHLPGRRLSLHLMVQPNIAPMLLADEMAMGQGFLSRLLVSSPESLQGKRFQREPEAWARPAMDQYDSVIAGLLSREPRTVGDNELDPNRLALTHPTVVQWRAFADTVERELAADGLNSAVRGLRNKIPEMALRIAGVLAGVEDEVEISEGLLQRGINLASYYLSEAKRLYASSLTSPRTSQAQILLRWLLARGETSVSLRDIQTYGPNALREASKVRMVVETLVEHHLGRIEIRGSTSKKSEVFVLSPLVHTVL